MTQKNQIATVETKAKDFLQKQIAPVIDDYKVRDYKSTNFIKSAMIAISTDDNLQEALGTKEGQVGLLNAMRMAAGTGLSLNPQEGKSALVCYNKKIGNNWVKIPGYQVMKNGLIELALESGKVDFITADTVRENDDFTASKTMNGDEYNFAPARKKRGEIDGFFAAVKMNDGKCHVKYMTLEEVSEHRKQFSDKTKMPEEGYGQKTVLKKLLNNLHISNLIDNAIGAESTDKTERDVTPEPHKGTGADDLSESLKTATQETIEAEVVEPDKDAEQMTIDGGEDKAAEKATEKSPI
jgi:phage RecT family recombinase